MLKQLKQEPSGAGRSEIPARTLRVLVASSDPDLIMLVRRALETWPTGAICRVAVGSEDVVAQFDSHAPDVVCWDTALASEPPLVAQRVPTLLLSAAHCKPFEPSEEGLPPFAVALAESFNREYQLRQLEVQLRDVQGAELRLRALLAKASDGIVIVSPKQAVLFANAAAARLCAKEVSSWVGSPFGLTVPEPGEASTCVVRSRGVTRRVSMAAAPTVWDGQQATVLLVQQVGTSASVPAMGQVRAEGDRLRSVGRLAAGVAHEVNNPLTFVVANLESLRESCHSLHSFVRTLTGLTDSESAVALDPVRRLIEDSRVQEVIEDAADMLTDCNKGVNRIQDIARSLGTFSRADEDDPEIVDITRIVDDACAMVFNQIRYRARLVRRFDCAPLVAVYPGRIAQALVNLLVNAADSIRGGSYDEHRIVVATYMREEEIAIAVSDTGEGISPEDRDQIFLPGYTTRAKDGAPGLGLSLCAQVAEEHGGRIEVHPLEGRGTRFELILPRDTGLTPRQELRDSTRPISEVPSSCQRLLIVDDDAMVLSALRRRLQRRYEVVTVLGGVEALALLKEDPAFDGIVCDLMMPEVDGKAFYEAIAAEYPELVPKTVFMSGGAFTSRLRNFAASVPNIVLQKPVTREHLDYVLGTLGQARDD